MSSVTGTTKVLITGGAGFIGSHLADELLGAGYSVRVVDNLLPQVHGDDRQRPSYLAPEVELMRGDVRDPEVLRRALRGVDAVFHFASLVGVGQSMYRVADYTEVNDLGTARLLEAILENPVQRLVVASSMSVYGEGRYLDSDGKARDGVLRSPTQLAEGRWEPVDERGRALRAVPTPEDKPPSLESIYALGKLQQERSCLIVGRAYGIPTVALRFFNVYGPRQALSNPYTGVLAIFAARCLNGRPPVLFEDGQQRRDFVHVRDVAQACRAALEARQIDGGVFNVGSGVSITIREVAERMIALVGDGRLEPERTGAYRAGDIRHCFADIGRARAVLDYEPQVSLQEGLEELAEWLSGQEAIDRIGDAHQELRQRGLTL